MAKSNLSWRWFAPIIVALALALCPTPAGLQPHAWLYFSVFLGVIVCLILEPAPGAVVAMTGLAIIAIFSPWLLYSPEQLAAPGFKYTSSSLTWMVFGFSNSVIWLIFAAFMFGTGYEKTGLGRRIALLLVKKWGIKPCCSAMRLCFPNCCWPQSPRPTRHAARGLSIRSCVTFRRCMTPSQIRQMIAAALMLPTIPLPTFSLMIGAAIGLGSIVTPYATGPSPIYYGSGYLPTNDYWRLGTIFGLIFLGLLIVTGLVGMPVVLG